MAIKGDRYLASGEPVIRVAAKIVASRAPEELRALFGPDVLLVPTPRHAPHDPAWHWSARRICEELVGVGLAPAYQPIVRRATRVQKAAFAASAAERPNVRTHRESFAVDTGLIDDIPPRILIVDDIVTRGTTLLAMAQVLDAAYPNRSISAFAMCRTQSSGEVEKLEDPRVETIRLNPWGDADRG